MDGILVKLGYGGMVAIIGVLVVFVGLLIIICALYLMAGFFKKVESSKAEKATKAVPAPAVAPAPVAVAPAAVEEISEEVTDDSELIAVIAAAIAAFDFGNKPVKIKSVRRMSGWQNAARAEQVYKF